MPMAKMFQGYGGDEISQIKEDLQDLLTRVSALEG